MTELHLSNLISINNEIKKIDDRIAEIRERITSPKNQIISDMPKGSGTTENALDNALTKIERLEARKANYYKELALEWLVCEKAFKSCHLTLRQIELLKYRYYYALQWEQCAIMMKKRHPNELWNENKVYRVRRRFVEIFTKNDYEVC